jgi:prepilin-type N-terminal cleavage/methylation domain-containing protein
MKINQKGFSVVEILIVIVVIGLLGAVGWLVYDRQSSKTSEKPSTQTSAQQNTETKKQETPKEAAKVPEQQYLEVKEWGVKLPLTDEISDLSYEVTSKGLNLHDQNQPVIKFFTKRLKDAKGICSANNFPITLNRGVASDVPITGDGPAPEDITANTYSYLYDKGELKPDGGRIHIGLIKLGEYYYTDALYPGSACSNYNDPVAEKARNAEPIDAIVKAVKSMQ